MTDARAARRGTRLTSWRDLRLAVGRHRRLLSAGLLAGAVALGITALSPPPRPTAPVVVAAADLPGGTTLRPSHLRVLAVPHRVVPAGALQVVAEAQGRVLAGSVREGELLTDVRMVGNSLLASYGDRFVAAPVRVADAEVAALLRPGDVIDVLAAAAPEVGHEGYADRAQVVASAVRVLTRPEAASGAWTGGGEAGALVVVVVTEQVAARLAAAAVTSRLSVTIRGVDQ